MLLLVVRIQKSLIVVVVGAVEGRVATCAEAHFACAGLTDFCCPALPDHQHVERASVEPAYGAVGSEAASCGRRGNAEGPPCALAGWSFFSEDALGYMARTAISPRAADRSFSNAMVRSVEPERTWQIS